jgi:hypothetical protein
LSFVIGGGAGGSGGSGTPGKAFENLERPLPGALGNVDSISVKPAIELDQIASVKCQDFMVHNNCFTIAK